MIATSPNPTMPSQHLRSSMFLRESKRCWTSIGNGFWWSRVVERSSQVLSSLASDATATAPSKYPITHCHHQSTAPIFLILKIVAHLVLYPMSVLLHYPLALRTTFAEQSALSNMLLAFILGLTRPRLFLAYGLGPGPGWSRAPTWFPKTCATAKPDCSCQPTLVPLWEILIMPASANLFGYLVPTPSIAASATIPTTCNV